MPLLRTLLCLSAQVRAATTGGRLLFHNADSFTVRYILPCQGRIQILRRDAFLLLLGEDIAINDDFTAIGKRPMIVSVAAVILHFEIPVPSGASGPFALTAPTLHLWHTACLSTTLQLSSR